MPELGRAYLIIIHGSICMHSVSRKEPSPILGVEVVAIVDRRVIPCSIDAGCSTGPIL